MSDDRAARLAALAEQIRVCRLCPLYEKATHAVPGAGDPHAEIMFIGEAPGEQEDLRGVPFVGRSGQYLDYLLKIIDLSRESVFITNVVKHRPPGNRDPLPNEIIACKPYLDEQIALIDPLVIVTLGRFSMARYFPNAKISVIHGQPKYVEGRAFYPMLHPAAALRNPQLRWDMEADIKRLVDVIAEVKQRRAQGIPDAPEPPESPDAPPADDTDDDGSPPTQLSLF